MSMLWLCAQGPDTISAMVPVWFGLDDARIVGSDLACHDRPATAFKG